MAGSSKSLDEVKQRELLRLEEFERSDHRGATIRLSNRYPRRYRQRIKPLDTEARDLSIDFRAWKPPVLERLPEEYRLQDSGRSVL